MKKNFLWGVIFTSNLILSNLSYSQGQVDLSYEHTGTAQWGQVRDINFHSYIDAQGIRQEKILYGVNTVGLRRSNLDGSVGADDAIFNTNSNVSFTAVSVDAFAPEIGADNNPTGFIFGCQTHGTGDRIKKINRDGQLDLTFNADNWSTNATAVTSKAENGQSFLFFAMRRISPTVVRLNPSTGQTITSLDLQASTFATPWVFDIAPIGEDRLLIVGDFRVTIGGQDHTNLVVVDNNLNIIPCSGISGVGSLGMAGLTTVRDAAENNGDVYLAVNSISGQVPTVNGVTMPTHWARLLRLSKVGIDAYSWDQSFVPISPSYASNSWTSSIDFFGCNVGISTWVGGGGYLIFDLSGNLITNVPLWANDPINSNPATTGGGNTSIVKYVDDGDNEVEVLVGGTFNFAGSFPSQVSRSQVCQISVFSLDPSYKYCAVPNGDNQMDYNFYSPGIQPNESNQWLLEESFDNGVTWNSLGDVFGGLEGGIISSQSGIIYRLTRILSSCASSCQFSSVFGDVQFDCGPNDFVRSETKSFSVQGENGMEISTLDVFPNPFNDRMAINAGELKSEDVVDVIIFDSNGAQVYFAEKLFAGDLQNGIDVSNLAAGMYLVVLKSKTVVYSYKALKN